MVGFDPRTALTVAQAIWAIVVFVFTLGGLAMWVKLKIGGAEKRMDSQDRKMEKLEEAIKQGATRDDLKAFKDDIIREMYALHGVDRRERPR